MLNIPIYQCHKLVQAFKIGRVSKLQVAPRQFDALLEPEDKALPLVRVDKEFVKKHKPEAGMYLVIYQDGYKSISPADAFEEGYTLMGDTHALDGVTTAPSAEELAQLVQAAEPAGATAESY